MVKERPGSGWEELYRRLPLKDIPWEEGKPTRELVELIESGTVDKGPALDICCGSANNAIFLAKHGFDCYGLDISPTAINRAQEKATDAGISCHLLTGNALHLTYPDDFFALVFDRGCFHSIPSKERREFIKGVHRVLKPGGKYQMICFSSTDPRPHAYAFSEDELRGYFEPTFKIVSVKEFSGEADDHDHYFLSVLMEKEHMEKARAIHLL
ncbi:MAG: class I SAM-dependent methyltransferase [Dehalococcoidia bacterium]|nr:class I SAM-dependent methyltransferase [Dehalococcoidia bacterium]